MRQKLSLLLLMALFAVGGVNAKTSTTTLWEGTYLNEVELTNSGISGLVAGDVIRVYGTPSPNGGNFKIVYKYSSGSWTEHNLPSMSSNSWIWVNSGNTYGDVTLSSDDVSAISTNSANIYLYQNNDNSFAISKVELIHTCTASSTTTIDNTEWTPSNWSWKSISAQPNAKIGDVICLNYTCSEGAYVQIKITDSSASTTFNQTGANIYATSGTYEYIISDAATLEFIQSGGFQITGDAFTLTSVQLLTYSDSYDAVSITIGSDGVATYSNGSKNIQISSCSDIKAYYASEVTTGTVTLTSIEKCIPANTGVIVKGNAGTYTVPFGSDGYAAISTNYLKPTGNSSAEVAASTEGTYHYIFAKHSSDIGFYKLTANHNLAVHKAYLETETDITPSSSLARAITLNFDDGTTAILPIFQDGNSSIAGSENNACYTLQGIRVQTPTKGLYIQNGKKFMVK